jgi:hypothetical protein
MKRALQSSIFVICVLFSVAAAYNVMSDNADVQGMAQQIACGDQGPTCKATRTFMGRSPIAQTFEFATAKRTVAVRCVRAFVFVGDYACALN